MPTQPIPKELPLEKAERLKRPTPARTEPIRNMSTLLESDGRPSPHASSFVEAGVQMGYRVIEDYIRQGQRMAEEIRTTFSGKDSGPRDPERAGGDLMELTERLLRDWILWGVRLAETFDGFGGAKQRSGEKSSGVVAGSSQFSVQVDASRPVEVSLDLDAITRADRVRVHPLVSADLSHPVLEDISLLPAEGSQPIRVRIRVPAEQPEGCYSGVVFCSDRERPCGTLTVRVGPARRG
jgi:hypothetical protein